MGTLGRPKAEVVEALEELGYGSFGLHGWRYPVHTTHRAAARPSRKSVARTQASTLKRDGELAVATAIGMAAIGATAAIAGFLTRELRSSRGVPAGLMIVGALGVAAMLALRSGRPQQHSR